MSIEEFHKKRKEHQLEEAVTVVNQYYERTGEMPQKIY